MAQPLMAVLVIDASIIVLTCAAVRYALPAVLQSGGWAVQQAVLGLAAMLLLPECLYTRAVRRLGGQVHRAAHDYGAVVACGACWAADSLSALGDGVSRACTAIHPAFIGIATAGILVYAARA
jgi:hypothetical protein